MDFEKMYYNGYGYAIKNTKTGKWIITNEVLYYACYGIKKKLKPYKTKEQLMAQLN